MLCKTSSIIIIMAKNSEQTYLITIVIVLVIIKINDTKNYKGTISCESFPEKLFVSCFGPGSVRSGERAGQS